MTDPHDARQFRQFVTFAPDGTVAATVLVAKGEADPVGGVHVDVSDHPVAVRERLTVDPVLVTAVIDGRDRVAGQSVALGQAQTEVARAHTALIDAVSVSAALENRALARTKETQTT